MLVSQRAWPLSLPRLKRYAIKALKRTACFGLAIVFIPWVLLAYVACGLLDVARNRPCTLSTIDRYFTGNGVLTWLLAPFNLLLDVLCLPYRNRGIYTLDDLPAGHRAEIQALIDAAQRRDLVAALREPMRDKKRGMAFFQWYGQVMPAPIDVPEFSQPYRYIRTVGVSIFNKRQSTGLHFGPLRITLRVLYNVNPINDPNVYITVGDHTHRWRDKPLFIFDDTLQHQSVNDSDALRCCLFVDILRPSPLSWALSAILTGVRLLMAPVRAVFYKHWTFMK
ncbi:MAG: aspartyl/asparaginyl beta-hydroxylase domain-containing protein [Planctomycetes bacterium]|nr:aspartyl/asparaginyl beta-hydroxylase domain-containing protein [Planctomycetota bacterium]